MQNSIPATVFVGAHTMKVDHQPECVRVWMQREKKLFVVIELVGAIDGPWIWRNYCDVALSLAGGDTRQLLPPGVPAIQNGAATGKRAAFWMAVQELDRLFNYQNTIKRHATA